MKRRRSQATEQVNQAVLAKTQAKKSELARRGSAKIVPRVSSNGREFTPLQMAIIRGLVKGYTLAELARHYQHHLVKHEPDRQKRLTKARTRVRQWSRSQKFRDQLWEEIMMRIDLESPSIVEGLVGKARAGRVDAARLVLELNGRHAPHTEVQPAQVNVLFTGLPRPQRSLPVGEVVDSEAEIDDAEWEPT